MALSFTVQKFADGRTYLRSVSTGHVTGADASVLMARMGEGAEYEGTPLLAVLDGKVELDPEARKLFSSLNRPGIKVPLVAIVTPNAPLRVMLSFVLRISGTAAGTRFFATEAEALAWLEVTRSA